MKDREEYISILEVENAELKKQLEEANKMCELYVKSLYNAELCECKNQQKEFIKYLKNERDKWHYNYDNYNYEYEVEEPTAEELLTTILSKYKEIIGGVEDEK